MDLPRYRALLEHWEDSPPVHVSVAAYIFGGKSRKASAPGTVRPIEREQSAGGILEALILPETAAIPMANTAWLDTPATPRAPDSPGITLDSLVTDGN